ncbi:MAG: HEAT repeat domain-containing protein [Anaerolineae bacterium]|nr:HEAT repeat domain-containing protein [Anaerolineae bacterium]
MRRNVAKALGGIHDTQAVDPLIIALEDPDIKVRINAVEALGEIRDTRAIQPLIILLKDSNWSLQKQAAVALGKLQWQPPNTSLRIDYAIAKRDSAAMVNEGTVAVVPLISALEHSESLVRSVVASALGSIGDRRAVAPLMIALDDKSQIVRENAAEALGKLGDARAVEPLILALQDSEKDLSKSTANKDLRKNAAEALGKLGDPRAVEPLIHALPDSDQALRKRAAEALAKIGDIRAAEPLISAIKDTTAIKDAYEAFESRLSIAIALAHLKGSNVAASLADLYESGAFVPDHRISTGVASKLRELKRVFRYTLGEYGSEINPQILLQITLLKDYNVKIFSEYEFESNSTWKEEISLGGLRRVAQEELSRRRTASAE